MFRSVVEAIFHYASTQPEKLCLADDNEELSYLAFAERISLYCSFFTREGLRPGERVMAEACQTIDFLAVQQALQLMKVIFVPVEHNCARERIASIAAQVGAAAIIAQNNGEYGPSRVYTFAGLRAQLPSLSLLAPECFPDEDEICEILFTTGTTGKEKGIVLSNRNNIALAENVICGVEMEKDNIEIIPSPMNHAHGLRRYYANMVNGSSVLLLGRILNIARFFELLDRYGANSADLVPSALAVLLRLTGDKLGEYRGRLRYLQFGAAPMMDADQRKICELLPGMRLYNFYGSTESGCICIYDFNRGTSKNHCIGKAACNARIFIVDEARQPFSSSADKPGLLASAGDMNMLGYWHDDDETERVLKDGVFYSNDLAFFDEDGDIILLGRQGDVINIGGSKVSPDEIEDAAKRFPGVADCGVIPVPDPMQGSMPKLFVQMQPGAVFNYREIREFLSHSLEAYKVPSQIVQIEKIPRSYNGKLLRRELK